MPYNTDFLMDPIPYEVVEHMSVELDRNWWDVHEAMKEMVPALRGEAAASVLRLFAKELDAIVISQRLRGQPLNPHAIRAFAEAAHMARGYARGAETTGSIYKKP